MSFTINFISSVGYINIILHFCKLRIIGKGVGIAKQYLELDIGGRDRKAVRREDLRLDPPNFKVCYSPGRTPGGEHG
jgi:hypothetical protein